MIRQIAPAADSVFVLRPERLYRMVLVVNGPTTCAKLEQVLAASGIEDPVCAAPQDWTEMRPEDWPREPPLPTAANECIVRCSGFLRAAPAVPAVGFRRDAPIEPGATYTIAAAWDCGEAPPAQVQQTGAAPASSSSTAPATEKKEIGGKILGAALILGGGAALWAMMRSAKREERDEERLLTLAAEHERLELRTRVQRYIDHGYSPDVAGELAARDEAAAVRHYYEPEPAGP